MKEQQQQKSKEDYLNNPFSSHNDPFTITSSSSHSYSNRDQYSTEANYTSAYSKHGSKDHIIKMPKNDTDSISSENESWIPQPYGAFSDVNVRKQFVRKVYFILSMQLLITVSIGVFFFVV